MFIIQRDVADAYKAGKTAPKSTKQPDEEQPVDDDQGSSKGEKNKDEPREDRPKTEPPPRIARVSWSGDVPPQKWMNFYMKVLTRFATQAGLRLSVKVDVAPSDGVTPQAVEEMKAALRELGLGDDVSEG
jgi:hypothetical protein